ncbi:PilW family protein [Thiocapsa rosea]|uniref:Type IV pilus assembly protein PilW n=1 Tax=Thiocapsa rosea TaxID=69360 RepID=A0A495VEI9_9GAMM|nr:hypothetical protein [Thiocapsa rosea]RKT47240.1 hypothetical protein BDD21_4805 [Thiocapsa rosea]
MRLSLPAASINIAEGSLRRQAGVTLTDLLVGTTVGALVLIGISTTYVLGARATGQNVEQARLNQEMRAVLEMMQQDIRRAGYWDYSAAEDPKIDENPFQREIGGIDHALRTGNLSGEPEESCLLYSYDVDGTSLIGVCAKRKDEDCVGTGSKFASEHYDQETMEMFGFQLQGQAVRMRTGRRNAADDAFTCNSGSWERITSEDVRITTLQFTITPAQTSLAPGKEDSGCERNELCRETRRVAILMEGQIRNDKAVRQRLQATVAVRNDRYFVKE